MKVEIPAELKSAIPANWFGKVLAATPVIMAVVATMLAGLASSEMTRAQYDRSLAAQQQSKAGDQWSFFQAKRIRGDYQRNTAELLGSIAEIHPLEPGDIAIASSDPKAAITLNSPADLQYFGYLQRGQAPPVPAAPPLDPKVKAALDAMQRLAPDAEMAALLAPVTNEILDAALLAARDQSESFDAATKPVNALVDQFNAFLPRLLPSPASGPAAGRSILRDFTAARLDYTAARYEVEARLNQAIANIYELQVRKSNFSAERHHARSQNFFYGMLGAQLGVIVSTLAMAARQRNLLWSLAAGAGLVAIVFAIYVYLCI